MAENAMNDIPGVPPPPAEVKVRTMRSDLESMAKSGGGLPQFQNVTVAGLAMERAAPAVVSSPQAAAQMAKVEQATAALSAARPVSPAQGSDGSSRNMMGIMLVIIVALVAIGVVGYFAYVYLGNSGGGSPAPAGATTP